MSIYSMYRRAGVRPNVRHNVPKQYHVECHSGIEEDIRSPEDQWVCPKLQNAPVLYKNTGFLKVEAKLIPSTVHGNLRPVYTVGYPMVLS
jgi:hypothetical protein